MINKGLQRSSTTGSDEWSMHSREDDSSLFKQGYWLTEEGIPRSSRQVDLIWIIICIYMVFYLWFYMHYSSQFVYFALLHILETRSRSIASTSVNWKCLWNILKWTHRTELLFSLAYKCVMVIYTCIFSASSWLQNTTSLAELDFDISKIQSVHVFARKSTQ